MEMIETFFIIVGFILILLLLYWPVFLPILIIYLIKRQKNRNLFKSMVVKTKRDYTDIDSSKLEGFDTNDIDKLKIYLFDIFYRFETAYNSIDYNTMYNLSTEYLYDMYHTSVTINQKFNEKKIIEQIELEKMIIYDAQTFQNQQIIYTLIEISYINYTQNSNGKIISGNPTKKIKESFEVSFVKQIKNNNKYKCPNCGASVNGLICDYCKSKLDNTGDYRIDSIKKIV